MNHVFNTFFAKPSSGSKSGKSPYGNRKAAGSDTDLSKYARDYHDSFEQAKERMRGSHRTPKAPEPVKASQMYYVDPTKTQSEDVSHLEVSSRLILIYMLAPKASSRSSSSRSNTPQPYVPPRASATPVPFPSTGSRTYQPPPPPPQPTVTPRRRTQSMSRNQAPDPNMFVQHLRKTVRPKGGEASKPPRTIYFYEKGKDYYSFTNFSPHPVTYEGLKYPTSEHLFQALKFLPHRPQLAEHIRTAGDRPTIPYLEARRFEPEVRSDWRSVNLEVMDMVLELKFTQHSKLMDELLGTGDAKLVE
ncbi:hypothetical protein FRB90_008861, partial [Tulasnella sp. 427]